MQDLLERCLFYAGCGQLSILIASALVPFQLDWQQTLGGLPRLHRQMYWVYGGYVVLGIVALALISLICSRELSDGSLLSRAVCLYAAVFWGVRLGLQAVFDVREHLTRWWLRAGYHVLTMLFLCLTVIYIWGAFGPRT
jgi:hypothetical protein